MKRIVIFSFLIVYIQTSYGQDYNINRSYTAIYAQVSKDPNAKDIQKSTNKVVGTNMLTWSDFKLNILCAVYFNANNISNLFCMVPYDTKTFNSVIKEFNDSLITISTTEWRSYERGNTYKIQAVYKADMKKYAIFFSLIEKQTMKSLKP